MTVREEFIKDEHLDFLYELREHGTINMYCSPSILQKEFGVTKHESFEIFKYWTKNFKKGIKRND